jgi:hypothetical protein
MSYSWLLPRTPKRGRIADKFAETSAEVRLIREAALRRDLAKRVARHGHQVLSAFNSHSPHILAGRAAETRFECAIELGLAELRHPGEISHSDLRMEVHGHVALDAARPPKFHEIAPSRRSLARRIRWVVGAARLMQHGSTSAHDAAPPKNASVVSIPVGPCID